MIYAMMTFLASMFWSLICFSIYLLLSCDGGMVIRWFIGLFVIMMYQSIVRFISMDCQDLKSFLLIGVGVASVISTFLFILFYITR